MQYVRVCKKYAYTVPCYVCNGFHICIVQTSVAALPAGRMYPGKYHGTSPIPYVNSVLLSMSAAILAQFRVSQSETGNRQVLSCCTSVVQHQCMPSSNDDLPYLAHHELESAVVIIIIINNDLPSPQHTKCHDGCKHLASQKAGVWAIGLSVHNP